MGGNWDPPSCFPFPSLRFYEPSLPFLEILGKGRDGRLWEDTWERGGHSHTRTHTEGQLAVSKIAATAVLGVMYQMLVLDPNHNLPSSLAHTPDPCLLLPRVAARACVPVPAPVSVHVCLSVCIHVCVCLLPLPGVCGGGSTARQEVSADGGPQDKVFRKQLQTSEELCERAAANLTVHSTAPCTRSCFFCNQNKGSGRAGTES